MEGLTIESVGIELTVKYKEGGRLVKYFYSLQTLKEFLEKNPDVVKKLKEF